jgi:hypothetical protein
MPIIGSLPYNLQDGTTGDASQVTANMNAIVNGVNANANPFGTLAAPSGTRKLFNNATAPAGWTTDATVIDHGLRITSSGGAIVSGTAYSTFLSGGWSPAAHTLTVGEMPQHTHGATLTGVTPNPSGSRGLYENAAPSGSSTFTSDNGTGGGGSHSHSNNTSWNYIACVVAQKS